MVVSEARVLSIEKITRDTGNSRYKLVLAAAQRAEEIAEGAQPLISTSSAKPSTIALKEIAAGKVKYEKIR